MSLLLDSHALLWFLERSPKMSAAAFDAMISSDAWLLSAISVAEAYGVIRKGKSAVTVAELFTFLEKSTEVDVAPVDFTIIRNAVDLVALDGIHDKIIVATAMQLAALKPPLRLVTSDTKILASNLVPTIW